MKDIYFDIIFWIGALVIILFGLLLMLWMLLKIINTLSLFLGSMYKVYEYLIYKKEFEEWSTGYIETTGDAAQSEGYIDYMRDLERMPLDGTRDRRIL